MPSMIFSFLLFLFIIDWSYTLSLHSYIDRPRRWNRNEDHDEVEIPLNETLQSDTPVNDRMNTTLLESNSTLYEPVNSTMEIFDSNENTTIIEDIKMDLHWNMTELQTSSLISLTTIIEFNQTNDSKLIVNESLISTNDEWMISSNLTQNDATIINADISSNESSILIPKSVSIPLCDQECQCSKECPYGFEMLNETCLCNPPCKNYPCFGNDTCIVTENGQARCQPANGTEHDRPIRCYQPRDAGYHDSHIRYSNRWYYHPDQDTCHLFVYRGLGGNENNFRTLHECHSECITCAPLPDPGECLGHTNMWYFDKKENQCKEFQYSGCKGNENKFFKKEQCIDACVNRIYNLEKF